MFSRNATIGIVLVSKKGKLLYFSLKILTRDLKVKEHPILQIFYSENVEYSGKVLCLFLSTLEPFTKSELLNKRVQGKYFVLFSLISNCKNVRTVPR